MKFSEAKLKEALERSALKLSVISLSVLTLVFGILLSFDLSKEALVVERGCETNLLQTTGESQTKEEIESFIRKAVGLRFDSSIQSDPSNFMVQDLLLARLKEQAELKKSNIDQKLIVRSIKSEGSHFKIEVDRVIAAGTARSAISSVLAAKISSKNRSLSNPYGLVLTSIDQVKEVLDVK